MIERTLQQRRDALVRANAVRSYRAQWKLRAKAGDVQVMDLWADPMLATMKVDAALSAFPKLGKGKARTILNRAHCSPSKTLDGLSPRQRSSIVELIPVATSRILASRKVAA